MTDDYRIEDVTWSTPKAIWPEHFVVYEDRELRWRERLAMRFLHRPDPRLLAYGPFEEGEGPVIGPGESVRIQWGEEGQ